jgi:hypothetical protein
VNGPEPIDAESDSTGLPGLRTWRSVYVLVSIVLAAYVVLLAVLTRAYK